MVGPDQIKLDRMDALIDRLSTLDYHYTFDKPLVSDGEYDQLYDELVALEEETGILRPLTHPKGRWRFTHRLYQHTHLTPLYSLDKSRSKEVFAWVKAMSRSCNPL